MIRAFGQVLAAAGDDFGPDQLAGGAYNQLPGPQAHRQEQTPAVDLERPAAGDGVVQEQLAHHVPADGGLYSSPAAEQTAHKATLVLEPAD